MVSNYKILYQTIDVLFRLLSTSKYDVHEISWFGCLRVPVLHSQPSSELIKEVKLLNYKKMKLIILHAVAK